MNTTTLRRTSRTALALAAAAGLMVGTMATAPADAATTPSWCPSPLMSGVAVDFGSTRIIAGSPIPNSTLYSQKNIGKKTTNVTITYDTSWATTKSFSTSLEAEYGVSALAAVKARVDQGVTNGISGGQSFTQTFSLPPGKRVQTWWAVDLRQADLRFIQHRIGCKAIKSSPWATFTAPRSGTVKPQAAYVS